MPRTLPWLKSSAAKQDAAPRHSRKREASPSSDLVNSDLDALPVPQSVKRKPAKGLDRGPSSSPPPAPPDLDVSFMRDGFDADDIFIMVEDEFDHTARLFTQHIHAAEYQRLKKLHKSRGTETLANLQRATDGVTLQSKELRIQLEQQELARKRKDARPKADESESSEEEDPYMQDPQLAGLMAGSQYSGPARELKGFAKAKSHTRAAAGYTQSPYKSDKFRDVLAEEGEKRVTSQFTPAEEGAGEDTDEDIEGDLDIGPASRRIPPFPSGERLNLLDETRTSFEKALEISPPSAKGFLKPFAKAQVEHTEVGDSSEASTISVPSSDREQANWTETTSLTQPPAQSRGGKGSRMAQTIAQRSLISTQPARQSPSKSIKQEQESIPEHESSSSPKTNSSSRSSTATSQYIAQRKEIKCEDDKKRRRLDDIPTFLF